MNPDQKFLMFVQEWAKKRGCTFVAQGCDGRESPELIDGMAVDDVWGWLLPKGIFETEDKFFGCVEWNNNAGKLQLTWNTYNE